MVAGVVSTLAGNGIKGYVDGTGTSAQFNGPYGLALDREQGNLYVADHYNNRIRVVTPQGIFGNPISLGKSKLKMTYQGVVTTLAGSGARGGVDGTGTNAQFDHPYGIVLDKDKNIYTTDKHRIRKITPEGTLIFSWIRKLTFNIGVVTTLAGRSANGFTDGLGVAAQFDCPQGMAIDREGNIYVADANNYSIRKVTIKGNKER